MGYFQPIFHEDWRSYPLGNIPEVYTAPSPWVSGNQPSMTTKVIDIGTPRQALECAGSPVVGQDDGARAFLTKNGAWHFFDAYEGRLVRFRWSARFPTPFTVNSGEGTYCQAHIECKDNLHTNAVMQIGIETIGPDSYYWLRTLNSFERSRLSAPVLWNTWQDFELQLALSRFEGTAKFIDKTHDESLMGTGPLMNPDTGEFGLAFLFYTNAIQGSASAQYANLAIDLYTP